MHVRVRRLPSALLVSISPGSRSSEGAELGRTCTALPSGLQYSPSQVVVATTPLLCCALLSAPLRPRHAARHGAPALAAGGGGGRRARGVRQGHGRRQGAGLLVQPAGVQRAPGAVQPGGAAPPARAAAGQRRGDGGQPRQRGGGPAVPGGADDMGRPARPPLLRVRAGEQRAQPLLALPGPAPQPQGGRRQAGSADAVNPDPEHPLHDRHLLPLQQQPD